MSLGLKEKKIALIFEFCLQVCNRRYHRFRDTGQMRSRWTVKKIYTHINMYICVSYAEESADRGSNGSRAGRATGCRDRSRSLL